MSEENTTEATETVAAEQVPVSLTVQDLVSIRNIIDVASQRGAFKANEFSAVGEAYNKLATFIEAITPAQEAPAAADAAATEAEGA